MGTMVINNIKMMGALVLIGLLFMASAFPVAQAQNEILVSRQGPYFSLRNAISDAGPNGVIRIRAGRYAASDLAIPYDLTIIGEGEVIITSPRPVAKGFLVPLGGTALEVRGLTFLNAASPDQNGAGIRFEGRELIVSNCTFINNENGILATGADASEVTVLGSRFLGNGFGDGRSHGIYMSQGAALLIENSQFEGTRIGHHVKSIATRQTIIRNNRFDDGNGQPSYVVDVTGGGEMVIEGNQITRRASAEQETLLNYDTSRRGARGRITIRQNQITNEKPGARLLRNPEKAPVYLTENSFENRNGGTLALPVSTPDLYDAAQSSPYPVVRAPDLTNPVEIALADPAALDLSGLTPVQRRSVEEMIGRGTIPVQADQVPVNAEFEIARQRAAAARAGAQETAQLVPEPGARRAEPRRAATEQGVKTAADREPDVLLPPALSRPAAARAPSPSASGSAILTLPDFLQRTARQEIVGLNLVPSRKVRATSGIVTFGQVFKGRAVRPEDQLALAVNDNLYPVQMDVKALYRGGSVRHGVLTMDLTGLASSSGRSVQAMLVKVETPVRLPDLSPDSAFNLVVEVRGTLADGTAFAGSVPLGPLVAEEIAAGRVWLAGPLALEASITSAAGPFLVVRADMRFLADNSVRTRLVFENHKTFAPGNRDLIYDVAVTAGGQKLFQRRNVRHYRGTNWSETIWRGRQAAWQVQLDTAYLISAGAVPPYDLAYGIRADVITKSAARLRGDRRLFGAGLLSKYFPTTGGRDDIGLLPGWDVVWLKTQNGTAREAMIAMAERAGAVPWHFEDEATGQPVRLDQRLKFWAVEDGAAVAYAPDQIPASYFSGNDGGWELDNAHKPLLSYTAYLATGDAYYARELAHEAAFSLARIWPGLRNGQPLVAEAIQVRSRAWALRDIANAAWILPDEAPLKDYFNQTLELNLNHLLKTYVFDGRMDAAGETEGWFAESVNGDPERISPWQNDYLVMVLAQEVLRGSAVAGEILLWASNYHKGRFLAAETIPALGAASVHAAKDKQARPRGTWQALMAATAARDEAAENYGAYGGGYVASAYGALASLYSATGDADLLRAMKALYEAQGDQTLFDPGNDGSIYAVPGYLLTARGGNGVHKSVTDLVRVPQ